MGGLPTNKTVYAFAASPTNPKIMFAGLREGAFRSTDGGESWKKVAIVSLMQKLSRRSEV